MAPHCILYNVLLLFFLLIPSPRDAHRPEVGDSFHLNSVQVIKGGGHQRGGGAVA